MYYRCLILESTASNLETKLSLQVCFLFCDYAAGGPGGGGLASLKSLRACSSSFFAAILAAIIAFNNRILSSSASARLSSVWFASISLRRLISRSDILIFLL